MTRGSLPRVLVAYALLGAAGLIAEVAWTRLFAVTIGSSTYALSVMLATYMAGIALGSFAAGRLLERTPDAARVLAGLCLAIAATVAVTPLLARIIPRLIFPLLQALHPYGLLFYAATAPMAALIMLPPALLLGAAFPYAARLVAGPRELAWLYAANTGGAMVGAMAGGFLLIPTWGVSATLAVVALTSLTAAMLLLLGRTAIPGATALGFFAILGGALAAGGVAPDDGLANLHVMTRSDGWRDIARLTAGLTIFRREGAFGPVVVREAPSGARSLYVAGRNESSNVIDRLTIVNLALLPIAAHATPPPDQPLQVFVLGLGTGMTAVTARQMGMQVTVAEIEPRVMEAVEACFYPGLAGDPGLRCEIGDARTILTYGRERYDVLASGPSYPVDEATAGCYTLEFYRTAAAALRPGGVACQWVPAYLLEHEDISRLGRTFAAVFHDVSIWRTVGSDLLLLGYRDQGVKDADRIARELEGLAHAFRVAPPRLLAAVPASPGELETDDRPRLEFAAARNLVNRSGQFE